MPLNSGQTRAEAQAEEIVALYDVSARFRRYAGPFARIVGAIAVAWSLFQVYTTAFGLLEATIQRALHVAFATVLIFLLFPAWKGARREGVRWPSPLDVFLALLGAAVGAYILVFFGDIAVRMGYPSQADIFMGAIAIIVVLEAARRVVGPILPSLGLLFLIYAYAGAYIPGFLGHRGYSLERIISHMYLTTEGIYSIAAGVSSTFVFLFILFGAFLARSGTGRLFIDLALALMGTQSGGPAKVAVVASGLMGTINGSSVANVVGTGTFTIPLMKSIGYRPHFAGAVEAAASTGGQLMPPVMGAGAFLMSEITGVPYLKIIIAAAIPALLYYLGVFTNVHLEAQRTGLVGLPRERLPQAGALLSQKGHLLLPIGVLIYVLLQGYTPTYAALSGIVSSVLISMVRKETRMSVPDIVGALHDGARQAISVAIACAVVGFIIGVTTLTGFGLKLAYGILAFSGGIPIVVAALTMLTSLLLGMGLPTTANYLVTSTIAAPALLKVGIDMLPAHLFVFYFGIIADLTPPVALAAMAGAGIAGAEPTRTGITSFRLAAAGYLVPYVFLFTPALLILDSPPLEIISIAATAALGVIALGAALSGYLVRPLNAPARLLLGAGALGLIKPGIYSDLFGLGVLAAIWLWQMRQLRRARPLTTKGKRS